MLLSEGSQVFWYNKTAPPLYEAADYAAHGDNQKKKKKTLIIAFIK